MRSKTIKFNGGKDGLDNGWYWDNYLSIRTKIKLNVNFIQYNQLKIWWVNPLTINNKTQKLFKNLEKYL